MHLLSSPPPAAGPFGASPNSPTAALAFASARERSLLVALGEAYRGVHELESRAAELHARDEQRRVALQREVSALEGEVFRLHGGAASRERVAPLGIRGWRDGGALGPRMLHAQALLLGNPRAELAVAQRVARQPGDASGAAVAALSGTGAGSTDAFTPFAAGGSGTRASASLSPRPEFATVAHAPSPPPSAGATLRQPEPSPPSSAAAVAAAAAAGQQAAATHSPASPGAGSSLGDEERQRIKEEAEFLAELRAAALFQAQELRWQAELRAMYDETQRLSDALAKAAPLPRSAAMLP